MPIYAYKCDSCGFAKDVLRKLSDPPLTVCPSCGAETFSKQVTAAGFQLKGSGWYVTDFRGDNSGKRPADAAESASAGDGKAEGAAKAEGGTASEAGASKSPDTSAPAPATGAAAAPAIKKEAASPAPASAGAKKASES